MSFEIEQHEVEKLPRPKFFFFDIDNTLMDTVVVFREAYAKMDKVLVDHLGCKRAKEVYDQFMKDCYNVGGRYKGKIDMVEIGGDFARRLATVEPIIRGQGILKLDRIFSDIYTTIPPLYKQTLPTLDLTSSKDFRIGFSTHSGEKWGALKSEYIWDSLGNPRETLLYNTIPLNGKKNRDSWKDLVNLAGADPREIVVVGDDRLSDIEEAFHAGIPRLIHIQTDIEKKYEFRNLEKRDFSNGRPYSLITIESLSQIPDILELY